MEQEPVEFYERVCAAYRELATREPRRVRMIDAARTPDEIEHEIWELVQAKL
jgi:dTMP kinase